MKSHRVTGFAIVMFLGCLAGTLRADLIQEEFTAGMDGWSGVWSETTGSPSAGSAILQGHTWLYKPGGFSSPSLVAGQVYRASFSATLLYDDGNAGDAILKANIGTSAGAYEYLVTPTLGAWQQYRYDFTATAADVGKAYEVSFLNGYALESGYSGATAGARFGIDSISLTAVPEPSAIIVYGPGILGLLAYAWRKWK